MIDVLEYYKKSGGLSDLGKYSQNANKLSQDPKSLSKVVQGIILHDMWIGRYNVTPRPSQWCSALTPSMENLLDTVVAIDKAGPFKHREPGERVIACCREFSTMLCGILRAKGVPARARCGFAPYMAKEGFHEDHWMCEYWTGTRWQRVDPQVDDFQLNTIKKYAKDHDELGVEYRTMLLDLDPLNLKPGDFLTAGEVWIKCRSGEMEFTRFGIDVDLSKYKIKSKPYGEWFVRGNLIRDFLALNKIETLPFVEGLEKTKTYWDQWTIMRPDTEIGDSDMELVDKIAQLTLNPDKNLNSIQQLYSSNKQFHPPKELTAKG